MDDAQRRCASPPHAARCADENCAAAGSAANEAPKASPKRAKVKVAQFIAIVLS